MDNEPHGAPASAHVDTVNTIATTSSGVTPKITHEAITGATLSPFYLTPFVLAAVTWWVATRKHPEEKEKWSMLALGFALGAVLMFGLVFFSERARRSDVDEDSLLASALIPAVHLVQDHGVDVLSPTRIIQGRSVAAGSLQITLLDATSETGTLLLDSPDPIDRFEAPTKKGEPPPRYERVPVTLMIGSHANFGFLGHEYQLGLLEVQRPFWGLAPDPAYRELLRNSAVIRLRDAGPRWESGVTGGPSRGGSVNIPPDTNKSE
jgi:hypothetical protein